MKLIFLGLKEGIQSFKKTFFLIQFLRIENPDIFCFTEADNWGLLNSIPLRLFTGLKYGKVTNFPSEVKNLAVFSKLPMANFKSERLVPSHGFLSVKIGQYTIVVAHLTTKSAEFREEQAKHIAGTITENRTILCGDFNAISPLQKYDKDFEQAINSSWIKDKFNQKFTEKTLGIFYQKLKDLFTESYKEQFSFPTKMLSLSKIPNLQYKPDHILVSDDIEVKNSKIINSRLTDRISDHYPLVVELSAPTQGQGTDLRR